MIKEFYARKYFADYYADQEKSTAANGTQTSAASTSNSSDEVTGVPKNSKDYIEQTNTLLWTITTAMFVVGGMVGAFASKYVADFFGRKKGIMFHHLFTLIGSALVFIAPLINRPECVIVSRFVYGVQGGMACGLIPTYLSEISPGSLRGATGVMNQLGITVGILVSQTLGFRQLLGTASCWHILLALPIVPAAFGVIALLLFFPESPRALLINNRDEESAKNGIILTLEFH